MRNSPCEQCIGKPCQFYDNDIRCMDFQQWKKEQDVVCNKCKKIYFKCYGQCVNKDE